MEFSRYTDVRVERLNQIAAVLCDLYPPVRKALPPIIAENLERLKRVDSAPSN